MCDPIVGTILTAVSGLASAASAVKGVKQAKEADKTQKAAIEQAKQASAAQLKQAEDATNKANAKRPNVDALYSANEQSAKGGPSGTMLTGPGGVDPSSLTLGRNTLLGM